MQLETENEDKLYEVKMNKTKEVDAAIRYLKKIFWHYANNEERYNFTQERFSEQVRFRGPVSTYLIGMLYSARLPLQVKTDLETLKNFVIQYNNDFGYDMTDGWTRSWTFPNSLLFTVTIMTTIGYGHIAPLTLEGKMFTIFYAMVGMPLLLLFMKDIGDSMAKGVRYAYRCVGVAEG